MDPLVLKILQNEKDHKLQRKQELIMKGCPNSPDHNLNMEFMDIETDITLLETKILDAERRLSNASSLWS